MGDRGSPPPGGPDLADLFREHAAGLAGAVRALLGPEADVPELLQEAFLKAWRPWSRGLRVRDPAAWIFVVTMNVAKDQRRKSQRRGPALPLEEVDPVQLKTSEVEPSRQLEQHEWLLAARRAIARLRETEKEVFLLRVSGGRSFEAVAEVLGIPVGTAKTRMRTALRQLRAALGEFAPATLADPAALPPNREETR